MVPSQAWFREVLAVRSGGTVTWTLQQHDRWSPNLWHTRWTLPAIFPIVSCNSIFPLPSLAVLLSRKWPSGAPHGSSHPGANVDVTRKERNRRKDRINKVNEVRKKNMKATETNQLNQNKKDQGVNPLPGPDASLKPHQCSPNHDGQPGGGKAFPETWHLYTEHFCSVMMSSKKQLCDVCYPNFPEKLGP